VGGLPEAEGGEMSENDISLPAPSPDPTTTWPSPYALPPPPVFTIQACLIECPFSGSGRLIFYLDVHENRTGITLHNVIAELEKGHWTIIWGLGSEVRWSDCRPLTAMKALCPPYAIDCEETFDEALISELNKHCLNLLLVTEFESRFVPSFKESVRQNDWDENRVCCW